MIYRSDALELTSQTHLNPAVSHRLLVLSFFSPCTILYTQKISFLHKYPRESGLGGSFPAILDPCYEDLGRVIIVPLRVFSWIILLDFFFRCTFCLMLCSFAFPLIFFIACTDAIDGAFDSVPCFIRISFIWEWIWKVFSDIHAYCILPT